MLEIQKKLTNIPYMKIYKDVGFNCKFGFNLDGGETPVNPDLIFNTLDYYDIKVPNTWSSKISVKKKGNKKIVIKPGDTEYKFRTFLAESNHFFDMSFLSNTHNQEARHQIYTRMFNNYKYLNRLDISNSEIITINDKCVYLSTSLTPANAGHDLFCILERYKKFYHITDIKFIIFEEHLNTNNYEIIKILFNPDRLIKIKQNTVYNFTSQIIMYETAIHYPHNHVKTISYIKEKIINNVETQDKYKHFINLKNKNVIIIKNSKYNRIVSSFGNFGDVTNLYNLLQNNWIIINPEKDDFIKFSYILLNAKTILTSYHVGISNANQIFYNLNARIIATTPTRNTIYSKNKPHCIFKNDIFCHGWYSNVVKDYITFPHNISIVEAQKVTGILNNVIG